MPQQRIAVAWQRWWAASKWWLLLVGALVSFVLGTLGFLQYRMEAIVLREADAPLTVVDAALLSLQLFVLNSQGEVDGAMPWMLQVARVAAPVIAFSAAIETFLQVFRQESSLARLGRLRGHVVVAGLGRKGEMLARGLLEKGERVVGIDQNPDVPFGQTLTEAGGTFLVGDIADAETLARIRVDAAKAIYFVASDDGVNFDGLQALRQSTPRGAGPGAVLHVQSMDLVKILGLADGRAGARFFSVYESGARALLLEYPAFTQRPDGRLDPLDLAIVGRGELCERLTLALAQTWAREERLQDAEHRQKLRVHIVDPDAEDAVQLLNWEHAVVAEYLDLIPIPASIQSMSFARGDFLPKHRHAFRVYITLRNEALALEAAWKLARSTQGREGLVVVATAEDSGLAEILRLDEARATLERITAFGLLDRSSTPDLVVGGTFEALARRLHEFWYAQFPAGKVERWESLGPDLREAAYRSADLVAPMLLSVGWRLVRNVDGDATPSPSLPSHVVQELTRREHERWVREGQFLASGNAQSGRQTAWAEAPAAVREGTLKFLTALPQILVELGFRLQPISEPWCQSPSTEAQE